MTAVFRPSKDDSCVILKISTRLAVDSRSIYAFGRYLLLKNSALLNSCNF